MRKKSMLVIILTVVVVVFGFSFIPILSTYQLYNFDQENDERLGEGIKFTDDSGRRCLLSDTIAGARCPSSSSGYNPNTGEYVSGRMTIDQLKVGEGGYADPYDPNRWVLSDEAFARSIGP